MLTSDRGAGSTRALTSFIEEEVHLDHLLAPVYAAASGVEALRHLIDAGAQFEPQIHAMVQAALQMQDDPTVIALSRQRMRTRFAAMRVVIARIEAKGRLSTGWDVETATAFLWSLTAPSTFDLLVVQHGWSPRKWAESTFQLLSDAFVMPTAPRQQLDRIDSNKDGLTAPPT